MIQISFQVSILYTLGLLLDGMDMDIEALTCVHKPSYDTIFMFNIIDGSVIVYLFTLALVTSLTTCTQSTTLSWWLFQNDYFEWFFPSTDSFSLKYSSWALNYYSQGYIHDFCWRQEYLKLMKYITRNDNNFNVGLLRYIKLCKSLSS